jgi:predicted dehydrogenase
MSIRWGLLGCGDIATKRVADAMLADPRSTLQAACRRDGAALEQFAARFQVPHTTTVAEDLIARDDVQAVYIATPVDLHCEQTLAAAQAGKHVLVEKPMALDVEQCRQMIEACDAAGVQLGVAYYRRFYPAVRRVAELLREGVLGRPLSILATTGNPLRFPSDDWRVVRSRGGGGPLMDIGSHRLDLFLMLLGAPRRVRAACGESPDYESEQTATLLVEYPQGCHGVLQCYFGTRDTPDRLEVIGTEGRVTIEDLNAGRLQVVTAAGSGDEDHPPEENVHAPLVRDFSEAVITGRVPRVTGQIGLATNRVIADAYRDSRR